MASRGRWVPFARQNLRLVAKDWTNDLLTHLQLGVDAACA